MIDEVNLSIDMINRANLTVNEMLAESNELLSEIESNKDDIANPIKLSVVMSNISQVDTEDIKRMDEKDFDYYVKTYNKVAKLSSILRNAFVDKTKKLIEEGYKIVAINGAKNKYAKLSKEELVAKIIDMESKL